MVYIWRNTIRKVLIIISDRYATVIAAIFVKTTPLFRAARDRCWCVHWLPQPA